MKIALIIRKLDVCGGVQRHVLSLSQELKNLGHAVKVYTLRYSPQDCYPDLLAGIEVVVLPHQPLSAAGWLIGGMPYLAWLGEGREAIRLAKALAHQIDPDTAVLNPHDHFCYKAAYFFKKYIKNIPSVWTMHDLPTKRFSWLRAREVDESISTSWPRRVFYWAADAYEIHKYIRPQDRIVVLDERDKNWAGDYFHKEAVVVRNGVDLKRFFYLPHQPFSQKAGAILMNGVFLAHRRFEDGIEALRILREKKYDLTLTIVGSTAANQRYYKKIRDLVADLGLESQVNFRGAVSDEELLALYHQSHVFLFPNHLQSWGLAVFEAMSCGTPVIVSKSAGACEILTHKVNAILVNPKSPQEIASGVEALIQNPELYFNLSRHGREFVERSLSWRRQASEMERVFEAALAGKVRAGLKAEARMVV